MMDWKQNRSYRPVLYTTYLSRRNSARGYTRTRADYESWAKSAQLRLKGWLAADKNVPVLDMGCGPGNFLFLLDQLGYADITGVDSGLEQVTLARQWCQRATIICGDVRDVLAQNPGRFGLITGFDIVEHFGKDELLPLLTLIARALKPGGRVILQTPNAESPWMGSVAYGDFTHEWFFTPASLADMLSLAGLTQFEARPSAPHAHGLKSVVRTVLWRALNFSLTMWNLVETGNQGSGIYTRVFVATATKQV